MGSRLSFDEELGLLHEQFTYMLSLTENAIDQAIVALKTQDAELAQKIIDGDDEIDKVERKIEKLCLEIMVRQNPIASDLRRVTSIFKLITDLERIADHAEDISDIIIRIKDQKYLKPLVDLPIMANKARAMVTKVIRSYLQRDVDMAYEVCADDNAVDEMNHKIYNDLVEMIKANPASAEQAVALISITKYFERIADHATNIAEWVVFNETGKHKRIG